MYVKAMLLLGHIGPSLLTAVFVGLLYGIL
jgi:hypothetical protein